MPDIYKTLVEIEYRANGDQANRILDQQFQRVAVLEKRYEKLNKMRVSSPSLNTDPRFLKTLQDVEKQFIQIRGEAALTIATNEKFNKSLTSVVSDQTAASLRLTALQKLNRTLPNNRISTEIAGLEGQGATSFIDKSELVGGAATNLINNLLQAEGVAGDLAGTIGTLGPLFSVAGAGALLLLKYITDETDQMKIARLETEALNEAFGAGQTAAASAGNEIARMTQLIAAAKQGYIDKDAVLKKYNETIGKVIGNTTTLAQAENLLNQQGEAYVKAMQLRATANALFAVSQKNIEKAVEEEFKKGTPDVGFLQKLIIGTSALGQSITEDGSGAAASFDNFLANYRKQVQDTQNRISQNNANENNKIAQLTFQKGQETINELIEFAKANKLDIEELLGLSTDDVKKGLKEVENVFLRELTNLREKIQSASIKLEISPSLIEGKFEADLEKELQRLTEFLEKKQLTQSQFSTLKELAKQLNSIELKKALQDYNDEVEKEISSFNDKVISLQEQSVKNNIAFIEDLYQKEIATINNEAEKTRAELERQRVELIKKADEDLAKFTDPVVQAAIRDKINQINLAYKQLETDEETERFQKLEKAAEKAFETIKRKTQEAATVAEQFRNRELQRNIENEFNSFISGGQSLQRTRTNVNQLQRDAAIDQLQIQLTASEKQRLQNANRRTTSEEELDKLQTENAKLDETIATLRARIAELTGAKTNEETERLLENLRKGIEISNIITDAFSRIIAEQERNVDREIAVQEKRIERLKDVADRGNAEMLEMEEKRLRQNQELKERYARQQLALQLIQQAGALTLAIAQAAAVPFPANIPAIAATIAAVAAGISTIKQLNNPVPGFKDGVVDFQGKGTTRSDSNIVAISNRESVMNATATANNKELLIQMNKGRKFVSVNDLESSKGNGQSDLKIKELTDEVKELRRDVRESKGTHVIMDKNGIVAIVEQVMKSNNLKWKL
jgi:hypothetical protein